ncbi:MAG: (E)-4-hydroxy-3-methylbut-2-enyl-diphosphate synthase, partial [Puniceicoccales bacterium]|nr:(E)-4-hydroxy-3-methylbut-2-enyl-diphosphate synthase [Puniceicoccales bacterium]
YCFSRYRALRRPTHEVRIGTIGIGAANPIRLQSMTTSDTLNVDATVRQCINLAEVGCEIIRITAPTKAAAAALRDISQKFRAAGFTQPLVADIHFIPAAAMEAVEHVEKVRINPGNYADKKRPNSLDYTDAEYATALQHLYDTATPLILRAKALGRALRIGTNHGSLSDRIVNRYGDSPLGMVESALEFIHVCESHGFRDIVLSMKSSNPKVMIAAYRLAAVKMAELGMDYPLHLGVTEAGEGQDGRIKSAIGIGALLQDGLGDTLRVSLTEDPWYEVPVAADLARRAEKLWATAAEGALESATHDSLDPFRYQRRVISSGFSLNDGDGGTINDESPPRVIVPATSPLSAPDAIIREIKETHSRQKKDVRVEGLLLRVENPADLAALPQLISALGDEVMSFFLEFPPAIQLADISTFGWHSLWSQLEKDTNSTLMLIRRFTPADGEELRAWLRFVEDKSFFAIDANAATIDTLAPVLHEDCKSGVCFTLTTPDAGRHALGSYRALAETLKKHGLTSPLWIRNTEANAIDASVSDDFPSRLLEASMLSGALFCDGLGDLISIETAPTAAKSLTLAYDILQGARMRISKTEYVACPSCGRTLFDIQSTTQKIKTRTGHLKGVTIAVMGCIVNGPGEMADADFGYVGGAPGKINLYVRRECVKFGIAQDEAVDRLIDLIKEHGKWVEPDETGSAEEKR